MIDLGLHTVNSLIATVDFSAIDFSSLNLAHFDLDWQSLAASNPQQFNQDVTKDLARGWNNFVKSGQIWALLIGVTLGYLLRSITSF